MSETLLLMLNALATKASGWQGPPFPKIEEQATAQVQCLNEIARDLGALIEHLIVLCPSEGAILAADMSYKDGPDDETHAQAMAHAVRAAYAVDFNFPEEVVF